MIDVDLNENLSVDLDASSNSEIDISSDLPKSIDVNLNGTELYLDVDANLSKVLDIELGTSKPGPSATIVHINTTSYWNSHPELIGEYGHIYVYSDYSIVSGRYVPAIKIGDGQAYLIDNPFVSSTQQQLLDHINNRGVHITPAERTFWNNKVRCDETTVVGENIMFTKN